MKHKQVSDAMRFLKTILTNDGVLQMGLLFVLLSPGLVLQMTSTPDGSVQSEFHTMQTNNTSVMLHALILMLLLLYMGKLTNSQTMFMVILFVALSPGFLLELPSIDDNILVTNRTSVESIIVHSLLFMLLSGIGISMDVLGRR